MCSGEGSDGIETEMENISQQRRCCAPYAAPFPCGCEMSPHSRAGSSFRGKNQGLIDSTTSPGKSQLLPLAQVSLLNKSMGSSPALLSAVAVSHCTCSSFHHSQTMGLLGYGLDAGDGNLTVDLLARNIRTISLGDLSVVGRLKSVPARPRPPVAKASIHIFPP